MWQKILSFLNGKRPDSGCLSNKAILVVDDGEQERRFISRSLEKIGCRVVTAANGEDALRLAREQCFHLVILDFYLPGMKGKEICVGLKADARTRDVPVIFLTGSASPTDLIDCYEAGAEYYLNKPISADQLVKQVRLIFQDVAAEDLNCSCCSSS